MRAFSAALALLACYVGAALLLDPHGTLGTDTGAKLATVRVMDAEGSFTPDVGYWAEREDPDGEYHPLYATALRSEHWVVVTTLPFVLVGRPLYAIGGLRLLLVVPMLGAVATAFAAGALARRCGGDERARWVAFALVGLATPVTIYALDFWEHSIGLALGAWALVLLVDALDRPASIVRVAAASALFGLAATMRTEALVYGAVAVAVTVGRLLARRRTGVAIASAAVALVAVLVPLLANQALERVVMDEGVRAERAGAAVARGSTDIGARAEEAFTTTVGLNAIGRPADWALGVAAAGLVAVAAWQASRRDARLALMACIGAAVVMAARAASGWGFVPGLFTASPLAVIGVALGWRLKGWRAAAAIGLGALPIVWAFQYRGGAAPQWGGRYVLLTGFVLAVGAAVVLLTLPRVVAVALVALAAAVTWFGVGWAVVRSHSVARAGALVADSKEPVLVSDQAYLFRELGAYYQPDRPWLTAPRRSDLDGAVAVVEDAGFDRFGLVHAGDDGPPARVHGFVRGRSQSTELYPGVPLTVTEYERD